MLSLISPRRGSGLLVGVLLSLTMCLATPAPSLADPSLPWTPDSSALIKSPRPCPSPDLASADEASCWSAPLDQNNPLYASGMLSPWGQCTYWALEMRPDLWNNRSSSDSQAGNWAAYAWAEHGTAEGLIVDSTPAAAAIMVWPQSSADPYGHVAYVQSVSVDPSAGVALITAQEFNNPTFDDPSQGQGDTITLRMSAASLDAVRFVHQPGWVAASLDLTATAPAPSSSASGTTPAPARIAVVARNPRLRLRVNRTRLHASSQSSAPLVATILRLPSKRTVRKARLRSGAFLRLRMSTGRYRICVSQSATATWRSAKSCAAAAW